MAAWETFENAYLLSWSDTGTPTATFVSGGSHGASTYYLKMKGASGAYKSVAPAGAGPIAYKSGAFKVETDSFTDGSSLTFVALRGSSGNCVYLTISKTGTQLQVNCTAYIDSSQTGTAQNISAGTWYYYCMYNNNTANEAAWYLSTDPASMGSPVNSWSGSNARDVATVRIGTILGAGTWGAMSTEIGYDSFDYDVSSMVHDAEDSGGTPRELAGVLAASSLLAGALYAAKVLAGQVLTTSALSGGLTVVKRLAAAIAAAATLSGSLTAGAAIEMAAVMIARSELSGGLRVIKRLAAAISAEGTSLGVLRVIKYLAGQVEALGSLDGTMISAESALEESFLVFDVEHETFVTVAPLATSADLRFRPRLEV
jgi:hypothetical protein